MKILIYGSTYITEVVVEELKKYFDLVGYIPSKKPIFSGHIDLPIVDESIEKDISLSIQYDRMILDIKNGFNLHTGMLPEYGGCDVLLHTIINGEYKQGLTFHKITDRFDFGPIILRSTYPVFRDDKIVNLYKRVCSLAPHVTRTALQLLEQIGLENVPGCYSEKPKIYKRGIFDSYFSMMYKNSYQDIQDWIALQRI